MNTTSLVMIPGWPRPTEEDIRRFQSGNRDEGWVPLVADGKPGPKTLGAIWRDPDSVPASKRRYTYLSHPMTPEQCDGVLDGVLLRNPTLNLFGAAKTWIMRELFRLVSGDWDTGFGFLSTQDGITIGFRRYAASSLAGMFADRLVPTEPFGATYDLGALIEDEFDNAWPLNEPGMRACFLALARSPEWHAAQVRQTAGKIRSRILEAYPRWRLGRTIALAYRAYNSAGSLIIGLSSDDVVAYDQLRDRYLRHHLAPGEAVNPTTRNRISDIEERFGAQERWR